MFTVLTYTKLFITNNNYTYTVIYQYHCNVVFRTNFFLSATLFNTVLILFIYIHIHFLHLF